MLSPYLSVKNFWQLMKVYKLHKDYQIMAKAENSYVLYRKTEFERWHITIMRTSNKCFKMLYIVENLLWQKDNFARSKSFRYATDVVAFLYEIAKGKPFPSNPDQLKDLPIELFM